MAVGAGPGPARPPRPGRVRRVPRGRGRRSGPAVAAPARQRQVCGAGDRHRAGTAEPRLSRLSRPPLQVRTESHCGAVAGGCAGAGPPWWSPVGAGGCAEPEAVAGEASLASCRRSRAAVGSRAVGTAWLGGRGARCLPRSGGRGRARAEVPLGPRQLCGRGRRARRFGVPQPRSGRAAQAVPRNRRLQRGAGTWGGTRISRARRRRSAPSRTEGGCARRQGSRSPESHFSVKTVAALARSRYRVSWNVLKE